MAMVHDFLTSLYTNRADFVFTVSRDFVRSIQTPPVGDVRHAIAQSLGGIGGEEMGGIQGISMWQSAEIRV